MRDWAIGQAGGSCYSGAALTSNDSKTRYNNSHLRHVVRGDVPDAEYDVLARVADDARRGDVFAVAAEGEGLGPAHAVPRHVEVDGRLLLSRQAGAGPRGGT